MQFGSVCVSSLLRLIMAQIKKGSFRRFTKEAKLRKVKNAEIYKVKLESEQGPCAATAKEFKHLDPTKRKLEYDNEKDILQKLKHKNVCIFIDAFVTLSDDDEQPIYTIFTEYSSKGSVFDLLRTSDIQNEDKRNWMIQLAEAVKYIHSQNIVHKDIRSSNCLVTEDNVLKLCEFGRAKPEGTLSRTSTTTATCNEEGAYAWKAPEVLENKKSMISFFADIYSMAIFFWELISEEVPFEGMVRGAVVKAVVMQNARPRIEEFWSDKITDLLTQGWAPTRTDRPKAGDILQLLSNISVDGK